MYSLHELETDAQVIPEVEVVQHVDDIVWRVTVLFPEVIQDFDFDEGLMMESLLIPGRENGIKN